VKPTQVVGGFDHSTITGDCSACHSYPGVAGALPTPNWLGATGVPMCIVTGGFAVPAPPAAGATTEPAIPGCVPHPLTTGRTCTQCHTSSTPTVGAVGYDHASGAVPCMACHEAGSTLIGPAVWDPSSNTGDTRPFSLSLNQLPRSGDGYCCGCSGTDTSQHWYGDDCATCHQPPSGTIATSQGGSATWNFHHPPKHNNPDCSNCYVCHGGSPGTCGHGC
jgi:hypothetical protein